MDGNHLPTLAKLQPQSPCSGTSTTTARCDPATLKQGKAELGACLTLVSPSGLTADDRREWLAVAMATLSGIPADLLVEGCAHARKHCRFPSEIVPAIMERVEGRWQQRKRWQQEDAALHSNRNAPRLAKPDYVDPAEVRSLIASLNVETPSTKQVGG